MGLLNLLGRWLRKLFFKKEEKEERICKDCGKTFYLTTGQKAWFLRQRPGMPELSLPNRCEECRPIHAQLVEKLGRSNLKVSGARSSSGCYKPFGTGDIGYMRRHWGKSKLNWRRIAEHSEIRSFNVDGRLVGLVAFQKLADRLLGTAWENAPFVSDYPGAELANLHYLIAESIKRGFGGEVYLLKAVVDQYPQLQNLGWQETGQPKWLRLPTYDAQLLVLDAENVNAETLGYLAKKAQAGKADLAWVAGRLAKGYLDLEGLEEFVRAKQPISVEKLQKASQGKLSLPKIDHLRYRTVPGVLGVLKTKEILKKFDPELTAYTEFNYGRSADLVVGFSKDTWLGVRTYYSARYPLTWKKITIPKKEATAFEVKAWSSDTYYFTGNLETLYSQVKSMSQAFPHSFVAMTTEFQKLPESKQQEIVQGVVRAGGKGIFILQHTNAEQLRNLAKGILRQLSRP